SGPREPAPWNHAEDGVATRSDRDRDGQDVVDEQGAAAHHAEAWPEELRRDDVTPTTRRKVLDDPGIRVADDEDGEGHSYREADRQGAVFPAVLYQLTKRLVGAVGARRESVCAKADPRKHRDERD